jgi:hypothetical protein
MRTRGLTCAAAMIAALVGQAPARAQSVDPSDVKRLLEEEQRHPHEISGVEVLAKRRNEISGVEVRARRRNKVSDVEVRESRECLKAQRPPDPDIPAPRLVSTFPAKGSAVRPGFLVLRLTFDLPMACAGLLDNHSVLDNPCPAPLREPVISRDRRTFLTVCRVDKNTHYGLWLNHRPELRFTSLAGRTSDADELVFDTSDGPPAATVEEAIAEDGWLKQAVGPPALTPAKAGAQDRPDPASPQ